MGDDYSAGWNIEDTSYLGDAEEERTVKQRIKDYCVNDGIKLVFIILYICANIALFLDGYLKYVLGDPALATGAAYGILGQGVAIARGAANALKLNCAFILIPVLRNFLSFLRGTWVNNYLPIDKNIVFHKYIGWLIFLLVLMHACAHYTNYWKLSEALQPGQSPGPPLEKIRGNTPNKLAFTTLPGATGHAAFLCLVVMYSAAVERVRRWYFEIFWYSHHLFIVFFAVLLAHGTAALLEPAQFWMWFIAPGVLYLIERIIRIARGSVQTIVYQAIQHPSKVIEIRLKRADGKPFRYKSGQYCFLNSPYLAAQEWHPFTITSTPNGDPYLSFHIKDAGDWTHSLTRLLNPDGSEGLVCEDMMFAPNGKPILRVDGGFGAASEDVFGYETVMLVGAGIGVTPFGSILKNIHYRIMNAEGANAEPSKIRKVHFYWVNRDKQAFEWFSELLSELENNNIGNFLEINVYLTARVNKEADIKSLMMQEEGAVDTVTGLQTGTTYGRPPWDRIFMAHAERYRGQTVGVFFCGPKVLSKELAKQCRRHTDTRSETKFVYNKENF